MGKLMNKLVENQIIEYRRLIQSGVLYQVAAYVLPLGTNVTMTGCNLRAWMEYAYQKVSL